MGDTRVKSGLENRRAARREGGLREAVVMTQAWMLVSTSLGYLDLAGPVIVIFSPGWGGRELECHAVTHEVLRVARVPLPGQIGQTQLACP